jgi:hypothetical protein
MEEWTSKLDVGSGTGMADLRGEWEEGESGELADGLGRGLRSIEVG